MTRHYKPKELKNQTIVITGASSEMGLATAKLAAEKGAKVVLAVNRGDELQEIGGKVLSVACDVSEFEDLLRLKDLAIKEYGQIDTWINGAANFLTEYLIDSDLVDEKKIFETNFWGTRYGSQMAIDAMKEKGGVIINIGSEISVAAQPLQGMYAASKQAVKTFTDVLRSELKDKDLPIEISLVRPTSLETDFEAAATAILKCAEHPQRDVYVGGPARLSAIVDTFFPTVKDMMTETRMKALKQGLTRPEEDTPLSVLKTLKENLKIPFISH